MIGLILLILLVVPSIAAAEQVYVCRDAGQHLTYTNKQLKGYTCTAQSLPALSVVPDRSGVQVPVKDEVVPVVSGEGLTIQDPPLVAAERQTYQINPVVGHNVASQVCDLYGKWLDLNLKTRGGLYYDSLTAPLVTMFGGGFIPMECRR